MSLIFTAHRVMLGRFTTDSRRLTSADILLVIFGVFSSLAAIHVSRQLIYGTRLFSGSYTPLFQTPPIPGGGHIPQSYAIKDTFIGSDFFDYWNWETFDDPTHGRVNYVDQDTAKNSNLSFSSDDKFVMRADDFKVITQDSRGRDSVRISSQAAYDEAVLVLDVEHMPEGCSTWPAFWTLSATGPWPNGGEIDIIEGVNLNGQNLASLHTTSACTMAQNRPQKGSTVSCNCDVSVNYNQGCGTSFAPTSSYGSGFNDVHGGYYVMQKSASQGINVWFWPRDDPGVPPAVKWGSDTVLPSSSWGLPDAAFPLDSCDYHSHFNDHRIVFDLTFCGDWAGAMFSSCGSGSCSDFVDNNPSAFEKAYWEINSLRVYTPCQADGP